MEIRVHIDTPELSKAIFALATALSGSKLSFAESAATSLSIASAPSQPNVSPEQSVAYQPAPVIPTQAQVQQTQTAYPQNFPTDQPPVYQANTPTQNAAPAVAPQSTTVPTATQTYSMDQLAVAATQLVDAGRRNDLLSLLASFGVQALTALPKEQYGAFATQLRAMGAKI